jgi:putative transposase
LKPAREHATNNSQTYFVTSETWGRRALFRTEPWARLFFKTLLSHRGKVYLLHEFVLMPDHFHLLISPLITLERAVQLIKGGFSYRAKRELGSVAEVWQRGFSDHRIRDAEDYGAHVKYIHFNPVKKHLREAPAEYQYSSSFPGWKLDPIPQRLKPQELANACGTAEAVPFQNAPSPVRASEAVPLQNRKASLGMREAALFQTESASTGTSQAVSLESKAQSYGTADTVPFQVMHARMREGVS